MLTLEQLDKCRNSAKQFQPRLASPETVSQIMQMTQFLPESAGLKQRYYTVRSGITSFPICVACGGLSKWDNSKNTYNTYCSTPCFNTSIRGDVAKSRAASRKNFRPIDAETIEELFTKVMRRDGNLNGNLLNRKHLTDHAIQLISDSLPFPSENYSIGMQLLLIQKGITEPPVCKECLEPLVIEAQEDLIRVFCSTRCSNRNEDKLQTTRDVCMERFGAVSNLIAHLDPAIIKAINDGEIPRLYREEGLNGARISERIGISQTTTSRYLNQWASANNVILSGNRSMLEKVIEDYLNEYGIVMQFSKRDLIPPYEVDIWLPDYNIGIEVHGDYWHSDKHKDKKYHVAKADLAEQAGITLFQFFEHEIHQRTNIVMSMILSRCMAMNKLDARKCTIEAVTDKQYARFLDNNHLQGSVNSSIRLGLLDSQGDLVSLIGVGKPRFNKNYDYELHRFCTVKNTIVRGGFSKLINTFSRNFDGSLLTYADRRYSTKNGIYAKAGFDYVGSSSPSYFYVKNNNKISRYSAQKHKLKSLLGECYNGDLSEDENMKANGYLKIWDAGQHIFSLKG